MPLYFTFALLAFVIILAVAIKTLNFSGVDRLKEYNCGERELFDVAMFNYSLTKKEQQYIIYISLVMFILVALGVFL